MICFGTLRMQDERHLVRASRWSNVSDFPVPWGEMAIENTSQRCRGMSRAVDVGDGDLRRCVDPACNAPRIGRSQDREVERPVPSMSAATAPSRKSCVRNRYSSSSRRGGVRGDKKRGHNMPWMSDVGCRGISYRVTLRKQISLSASPSARTSILTEYISLHLELILY